MMKSLGNVRRAIEKAYKRQKKTGRGGWREVGRAFGITGGMAFRIAVQGYDPPDTHIRARLGLPAFGKAPACVRCGEVHVTKRCTNHRKGRFMNRPYKSLWEWPVEQLKKALLEREEV